MSWRNFNTVAMRALPHAVNHYVNDTQVSHCSPGAKTINGTFYWLGDVVAGPQMPLKLDWVRVCGVGVGVGVGEGVTCNRQLAAAAGPR